MTIHLTKAAFALQAKKEAFRERRRKARSDIRELWSLQEDFGDTVDEAWRAAMEPAIEQFARGGLSSPGAVADGLRRLDQIAIRFGRSEELQDYAEEVLRGAYAFGVLFVYERWEDLKEGRSSEVDEEDTFREPAEKAEPDAESITAQVSFTLADQRALDELSAEMMVWFRDRSGAEYYDPQARAAIVEQARKMIAQGRGQSEVAEALREAAQRLYGVATFATSSRSYWAGVAEHMAVVAGVRGQITEMSELGFTHYTLVNPMDDRTSRICTMMNGKSAVVQHAAEHQAAVASATTPDEIRARHPYAPGGSTKLLEQALGRALPLGAHVLSNRDSATLKEAGLPLPPFHHRCRTWVDVYYDGPGRIPRLPTPPPRPNQRS